jgi:hypothetical protein
MGGGGSPSGDFWSRIRVSPLKVAGFQNPPLSRGVITRVWDAEGSHVTLFTTAYFFPQEVEETTFKQRVRQSNLSVETGSLS